MKNLIKIFSLLVCFCLIFTACTNKQSEPEMTTKVEDSTEKPSTDNTENSFSKGDGKISLPFNESDGLNPYFAKSDENLYLAELLFDSLFSVDSAFTVSGEIAESIDVKNATATVKIRKNVACYKSSSINAEDVVYSFNLAKASYSWGDDLKGIASAEAVNQYTVKLNLDFSDTLVSAKLTFPVVKKGTADIKTAVPNGSGEYYYNEGRLISAKNKDKQIYLHSVSTRDSVEDAFKIGMADVFFSNMSDCNYIGTAGKTQSVLLNNMVYLGLNSNRGALTKPIRSAIAAKLNCEELVLSAYQGHGKAVKLPVNPNSEIEYSEISTKGDKELADSIIDRCGYTRYSGNVKTNGAYKLSFTLIVNNDNKYRVAAAYNIADSLKECGFNIKVESISFANYKERISSGNYDIYLGEVRLDSSMDLSPFFASDGKLTAGINKDELAGSKYYEYRAGKISAQEYYEIFAEEYPFVPLLFKSGYVVTSQDVELNLKQMPSDLYAGI